MRNKDNLKGIKAAVVEADREIGEIELTRKACTDDIGAVMDRLESIGISRHAMRFARRYMKMDENQRRSLDTAYTIAREALGEPVQGDLYDTLTEFAEGKKAEADKEKEREARRQAKAAPAADGETTH